jgi:hypothetical protein
MRSRIFALFACFAVGAFLMSATPAYAYACGAQPCQRDPGGGGGGGGYTCVTNCTECHYSCSPNNNCVWFCANAPRDGGCGCEFSGDHAQDCGDAGSCTYE